MKPKGLTLHTKEGINCFFFIEKTKDNRYSFSFDSSNGDFKRKDIKQLINFLQDYLKETEV